LSPASETRVDLLRLLAELDDDRAAAQRRRDVIAALSDRKDVWLDGSPFLAVVALELHHYYSALERCLERIILAFEGKLPGAPDWHRELLHLATLAVPDVRPGILSKAAERPLAELMRFRHFLRHAYAAELESGRLRVLASGLLEAHPQVTADLDAFQRHVRHAADALRPSAGG